MVINTFTTAYVISVERCIERTEIAYVSSLGRRDKQTQLHMSVVWSWALNK